MMAHRDERWHRILEHAPVETLIEILKNQPKHSASTLAKGTEAIVDEIFRLCDQETIRTLYEEFPGPENFATWFYRQTATVTKETVLAAVKRKATPELRSGTKPNPTDEPSIYKIEQSGSSIQLRYVAKDRTQNLATDFDEISPIKVLSFYQCVFHFSSVVGIIFGPYSSTKADAVMLDGDQFLGLGAQWQLLKPQRGRSREFYRSAKGAVGGLLIATKRHDPSGDYKTITLEARQKQPDLEDVPDFKKRYLNAASYYDVIQFTLKNRLGLQETSHVRFGRPFGRFTFKAGTSLSAIMYFQAKISGLLR